MPHLLDFIAERVLLFDGGMGSLLAEAPLAPEDFRGQENCSEVLLLSRPDVIRDIHLRYFEAGSNAVETATFGANRVVLREFGLEERVRELNLAAVQLAREAAAVAHAPALPRFVVGSVGPGTRLPSLGQIAYEELEAAYREQGDALLEGGVDALLVETCQDPLQFKAAIAGLLAAKRARGLRTPLMLQVTLQPTGTLLVGTDIATALAIVEGWPLEDLATFGVNCATGPREMSAAVRYLGAHSRRPVSVQPNAGLPEIHEGRARYTLSPGEFADWLERFVVEDGVSVVGGCCGTTPAHIACLAGRLASLPSPRPRRRAISFEPSLASLFRTVPLRQDADVLAIGERTNANGSEAFRKRLLARDWDGIVAMARQQVRQGSHALDVCCAWAGRDEKADMTEIVSRLRVAVEAPLVVDSTELDVLETALRLHGGKCLVNSIHLEDGGLRARAVCRLARKHGAALIALCIDEEGMAREATRKLRVAERLHELATSEGIASHDLLFDPLTFTLATGQAEDRRLGLETLDAISLIARRFPESGIILGVSNVSHGLAPAARQVLNAVMLHQARQRGLTAAILHQARVLPLHRVPEARRLAAEDLLLDRRDDALSRFLELFDTRREQVEEGPDRADLPASERLARRVVEGDADGLEADLGELLEERPALEIVNGILLPAMRDVGRLFGEGSMQLPFVLQSAETMKKAVAFLEPALASERSGAASRGRILLATVRGDVHDIGKNLVGLLLANNGFEVVDLGIRQGVEDIVRGVREHDPDAIGLSGLLVRSTEAMRETLAELRRHGIFKPVVLGGAALTRRFAEVDCAVAYGHAVAWARDAFDGLRFMEEIERAREEGRYTPWHLAAGLPPAEPERHEPEVERRLIAPAEPPTPPFLGAGVPARLGVDALLPFLDRRRLFEVQWGFQQGRLDPAAHEARRRELVEPLLEDRLERWARLLEARAVYGYFRARGERGAILLLDPHAATEILARIPSGRLRGRPLTDYIAREDLVALQAVTLDAALGEAAHAMHARGEFRDYLLLHGLGAALAEAAAAALHARIRAEWGIAPDQGRRLSPGYPALPDLGSQSDLLRLLDAGRVGLSLNDALQLEPEHATTALVFHHPALRS